MIDLRKDKAFIVEKAAAAGVASIYDPQGLDLAQTLNIASSLQTMEYLRMTSPDNKEFWKRVKELVEMKQQVKRMIRDFLSESIK